MTAHAVLSAEIEDGPRYESHGGPTAPPVRQLRSNQLHGRHAILILVNILYLLRTPRGETKAVEEIIETAVSRHNDVAGDL